MLKLTQYLPTRDSQAWWWLFAAAIVGYLSTADPPSQWVYKDWLNAATFVIGWFIGKSQTSQQPHSEHGAATITPEDRKSHA